MRDGSPQVAPVWVGREGDLLLVGTGEGTLKAKNTRRDEQIGLSVIDQQNPYREAQIRGEVIERRPDQCLEIMDAIAHKYTGKPFPWGVGEGHVVLVVRADKVRYSELLFEHTRP